MTRRTMAWLFGCVLLIVVLTAPFMPARASQGSCVLPTTGTVSGLTLVNDINSCVGAILSVYSGGSAPSSATTGMLWWNTSTGIVSQYDGADWVALWYVDTTNHLTAIQIGGGTQQTVASDATTDLWSVPQSSVTVSGTTTITQLANADAVPGSLKIVTFQGILTLTQGTPIGLPNGGSNITTAAGDYAIVLALGSTNVQVVAYMRANGTALSSVGISVTAASLANSSLASLSTPTNLQLNAALESNELTVSFCTTNSGSNTCNNPSSTNPVLFGFPDSVDLYYGDPVIVSLQAAASITTSATADNMGCVTAVPCHIWIWAIDNGGTVVPCLYVPVSGTTLIDLDETANQSSASGTGTGTSAQTLYCSASAVSGKAVRRIGYIEATWTSGTGWTSLGKVRLFGPGVHKPGEVIQRLGATVTNSLAITPTSAANLVKFTVSLNVYLTNTSITMPVKRGSTTLVNRNYGISGSGVSGEFDAGVSILDAPATTSSVTYSVAPSGGTIGGQTIVLEEIMA